VQLDSCAVLTSQSSSMPLPKAAPPQRPPPPKRSDAAAGSAASGAAYSRRLVDESDDTDDIAARAEAVEVMAIARRKVRRSHSLLLFNVMCTYLAACSSAVFLSVVQCGSMRGGESPTRDCCTMNCRLSWRCSCAWAGLAHQLGVTN
jgi:hypothetical protein